MITGRSDSGQRSRSCAQHVDAREARHHDVEQHEVEGLLLRSARAPARRPRRCPPRSPACPSRRESMSRLSSLSSTTRRRTPAGSTGPDRGRATGASGNGRLLDAERHRRRVGVAEHHRRARGLRRRDGLVHRLERLAGRLADLAEVGEELVLARVADLVLEQLRVADDLVERGAKVVPQPGPRVDLRVAHGRGSLTPPRPGHVRRGGAAGGPARPPPGAGPPGGPPARRSTRAPPRRSGRRPAGRRAAAWSARARPGPPRR